MAQDSLIESYNCILDYLKRIYITDADIIKLRSVFQSRINSQRRVCYITDIKVLLSILEKRGLLNQYSINPLFEIFTIVKDERGNDLLNTHAKLLGRWRQTPMLPQTLMRNMSTSYPDIFKELPQFKSEVIELICDLLGPEWIHFGRGLGLKENEICYINDTGDSYSSKVRKCLQLYLSKRDVNMLKIVLEALSYARRNDIKMKTEVILMEESLKV